jgi:hypothetical protein
MTWLCILRFFFHGNISLAIYILQYVVALFSLACVETTVYSTLVVYLFLFFCEEIIDTMFVISDIFFTFCSLVFVVELISFLSYEKKSIKFLWKVHYAVNWCKL